MAQSEIGRLTPGRLTLPEALGVARSLLIYYATPFRLATLRRFSASFLRRGDLAFDIGAHAGNRVYAWTRLGVRVVAVEPNPVFTRLLRRMYGRRSDVTVLDQALGAAEGRGLLQVSRRAPTVSSLSPGWIQRVRQARSFAGVRWDAVVAVEVTTLDHLIRRFGVPAFCKIDVEGAEPEVLAGLRHPLPCLSFEAHPAALNLAQQCLQRLEALGPHLYNWSEGETHRWTFDPWLSVEAMERFLRARGPEARAGDVYARLRATDS